MKNINQQKIFQRGLSGVFKAMPIWKQWHNLKRRVGSFVFWSVPKNAFIINKNCRPMVQAMGHTLLLCLRISNTVDSS